VLPQTSLIWVEVARLDGRFVLELELALEFSQDLTVNNTVNVELEL
jgi:hypothetical protein